MEIRGNKEIMRAAMKAAVKIMERPDTTPEQAGTLLEKIAKLNGQYNKIVAAERKAAKAGKSDSAFG